MPLRIQQDLVALVQSTENDGELVIAVAEFQRPWFDTLRGFDPAQVAILGLNDGGHRDLQNILVFGHDHLHGSCHSRPQSVDEVGEAKRAWQKLVGGKEEQRAGFKKLEELNRLIRSAATGRGGGGAVDVSALSNKWEELEVTLEGPLYLILKE